MVVVVHRHHRWVISQDFPRISKHYSLLLLPLVVYHLWNIRTMTEDMMCLKHRTQREDYDLDLIWMSSPKYLPFTVSESKMWASKWGRKCLWITLMHLHYQYQKDYHLTFSLNNRYIVCSYMSNYKNINIYLVECVCGIRPDNTLSFSSLNKENFYCPRWSDYSCYLWMLCVIAHVLEFIY